MIGEKVNILLVDDQPAKLLSYEVVLGELGETLLKASSAREAFEHLLRTDVAVVLMDVAMPEMDGFELAAMVRDHPRFQHTAIIFVSAIHLTDVDFLRGYQMGAVDYVPVPVVPELLRAKVRVFAELYRKNRQLELLNAQLEARVAERTAALEASTLQLRESEHRRNLALAAGRMGSWDWDLQADDYHLDDGQYGMLGLPPGSRVDLTTLGKFVHEADWERLAGLIGKLSAAEPSCQAEFRIRRDGEVRWCLGTAAASIAPDGTIARISGVTTDITERKRAEERQALLAREIDHRAKNALALVQSIVRLSRGKTIEDYIATVEGRIGALSRAHSLLADSRWEGAELSRLAKDELAPYGTGDPGRVSIEGPALSLDPQTAQGVALALHELTTNAAKYGALSLPAGRVSISWNIFDGVLMLSWAEDGGPPPVRANAPGFGLKVIAASIIEQLGGEVQFDWPPSGLRCALSMRVEPQRAQGTASARPPKPRPNGAPLPAKPLLREAGGPGKTRIMLVEDDVVIGMMMQDLLTQMDFAVAGPIDSVSSALRIAEGDALAGAVLDVNVRDGLVYPVASALTGRGIPFVFVTGLGADSIDKRFAHVPIVEKPINPARLKAVLAPLTAMRRAPA